MEKKQSQNEIAYKQQYEAPVFLITSCCCCCCCDPNLPEHLSVFHQLISVHAPVLSTDILLPADSSVPSLPDSAAWCNTNRLMTNEPFDLTCPARWICFWVLSTSVKQWATARQSAFARWRWLCLSLTSCLNQPAMCKHSLFLTKHVFFCVCDDPLGFWPKAWGWQNFYQGFSWSCMRKNIFNVVLCPKPISHRLHRDSAEALWVISILLYFPMSHLYSAVLWNNSVDIVSEISHCVAEISAEVGMLTS